MFILNKYEILCIGMAFRTFELIELSFKEAFI